MTVQEIFKLLMEEAGEGGAVVLFRAKSEEDITILADGSNHMVNWVMTLGVPDIRRQCFEIAANDINVGRNGMFGDLEPPNP